MRGTTQAKDDAAVTVRQAPPDDVGPGTPEGSHAAFHLAAACGLLAAWYVVLTAVHPTPIGDETYYLPSFAAAAAGDRQALAWHSVTPTYLQGLVYISRLTGGSIWALRAVMLVQGVLAVLVTHALLRSAHTGDTRADRRLWLLVLNPLLVSLWVLVYTDMAALLVLLLALAAQRRGSHAVAAGALVLACLVRQSNVVWFVFFAVAAWRQEDRARCVLRYVAGAAVAGALMAVGIIRVLPNPINGPRFNPAQPYFLALTAALLYAPLWLAEWPRLWSALRRQPLRAGHVALLIGVVAVLTLTYTNPHGWNADLAFLRNRPLVALEHSIPLRIAVSLGLVAAAAGYIAYLRRSGAAGLLGCAWLIGLLHILPLYLVDPRYYIVLFVLLDLLMPYSRAALARQIAWYGAWAAGIALYVLMRPGGGVV